MPGVPSCVNQDPGIFLHEDQAVTNLGSIGNAPDPTTAPEVATGMRKLHADQGYSQAKQPVQEYTYSCSAVQAVST